MSRTTRTLFVALAAFFTLWSIHALTSPKVKVSWAKLGIDPALATVIGTLEFLGALALLMGLRYLLLGLAASLGLFAMMIGATVSHLRVGDVIGAHGSVVVGLVALGAIASALSNLLSNRRPSPEATAVEPPCTCRIATTGVPAARAERPSTVRGLRAPLPSDSATSPATAQASGYRIAVQAR